MEVLADVVNATILWSAGSDDLPPPDFTWVFPYGTNRTAEVEDDMTVGDGGLSTADVHRIISLGVLISLAVPGNLYLIATIWMKKLSPRDLSRNTSPHRQTCADLFIVNLAAGDLAVSVFTMTSEMLFVVFGGWVLGEAACKLIVYVQIVTLASTTFLLVSMSIDCYRAICAPLSSSTRKQNACRMIILSWTLPLILALPQLFIFVQNEDGKYVDGAQKYKCTSQGYTASWQRKVYFTWLTTYILVIPAFVITYCYTSIIRAVYQKRFKEFGTPKGSLRNNSSKRQSRNGCTEHGNVPKVPNSANIRRGLSRNATALRRLVAKASSLDSDPTSSEQNHAVTNNNDRSHHGRSGPHNSRAKMRTIWLTLCIVGSFTILWSPYFVVTLIQIYSNGTVVMSRYVFVIAEAMALANSVKNPLLYVLFSRVGRKRRGQAEAQGTVRGRPPGEQYNSTPPAIGMAVRSAGQPCLITAGAGRHTGDKSKQSQHAATLPSRLPALLRSNGGRTYSASCRQAILHLNQSPRQMCTTPGVTTKLLPQVTTAAECGNMNGSTRL